MMNKNLLFKLTVMSSLTLTSLSACYAGSTQKTTVDIQTKVSQLKNIAPDLNTKVLTIALKAYNKAREQGYDNKKIFSVVDFSIPDYEKQLWVFNLDDNRLLYHTYVAHGRGSGDVYATKFSNQHQSLSSSLGMYLTNNTYYGHDGLALRLTGLSRGFNDSAYSRAVVMHGARYVSEGMAKSAHRIGRSWGCPAVPETMIKPISSTIKNGTLLFIYGNDHYWLTHGPYVA